MWRQTRETYLVIYWFYQKRKRNNGLMSEVDPVALVIGVQLILGGCVWFNRNHTYMRARGHIQTGAHVRSIMVLVRHLNV